MGPTAALLLVVAVAGAAAADASPAPPPAESAQEAAARCAAAIVSISPCLPHLAVGAPPVAPTDACCVAFLRAVSPSGGGGGGEGCLCHLLHEPLLLGFPVDPTRLGALLPACAAGNSFAAATVEAATLFADACRELKTLPEMHVKPQSITKPSISPAAVPELVSVPKDKVPPSAPSVPSGAAASCSRNISLAALILGAAGAVIAVHL